MEEELRTVCLDTDVVIDYLKQTKETENLIERLHLQFDEVVLTAITKNSSLFLLIKLPLLFFLFKHAFLFFLHEFFTYGRRVCSGLSQERRGMPLFASLSSPPYHTTPLPP
jgi:hypothetical protein